MGAAAFLLAQGVVCRAGPLLLYEYTTQFKCHNITRVGESPPGCELGAATRSPLVVDGDASTRPCGRHSSRHTRESGPGHAPRDPGSSTPVRSFVRGVVLVNIHTPGTVARARGRHQGAQRTDRGPSRRPRATQRQRAGLRLASALGRASRPAIASRPHTL